MLLTIGMATYNDFNGVYFTLQALKAYHDLEDVELLVVDTKPELCNETKSTCENAGAKYIHAPDKGGTSQSRNHVFEMASGKFVMCIDCHVLLFKDSIKKLKEYLKGNENSKDIIQGPLLYDDQKFESSHFAPGWNCNMYGTWGTDVRLSKGIEFEIPMQGLGLFCMRKDVWPTFNKHFKGFGGEEGYIQEKVRQNGGKAICLPFLKWMHRFGRPDGVPYPLDISDRIFNYIVGWTEIGWNHEEVINYFNNEVSEEELNRSIDDAIRVVGNTTPINYLEKNDIKIKAYIVGSYSEVTERSFSNMGWDKEKEYMGNASLKLALEKFVREGKDYGLICMGNVRLDKSTVWMIKYWSLIRTRQAKVTIFNDLNKDSLRTKHSQLSYRIADYDELDDSKMWMVSSDFAKMVLNDYKKGKEFSYVCEKESIVPFVYLFEEDLFNLRMQYVPLHNVSGGLSIEAVREIVWAARKSCCLEISSNGLQSTIALCQRGSMVMRVGEYKDLSKDKVRSYIESFGYKNFILGNKEDSFESQRGTVRTLLVNHNNLSKDLKEFSLCKEEKFLRVGDNLIIINAVKEVMDSYKDSNDYKVDKYSDDYLILNKL